MVSYRTLSKIASAQHRAHSMQLEGTAARLDALRKELERHKRLPEGSGEGRLFWAIAKLDDTKRTLEHESGFAQRTGCAQEYEDGKRTMGRLVKSAIFLGMLVWSANCLSDFFRWSGSAFGVIAAAAALAFASQIIFGIVDRIICSGSFQDDVDMIRCSIEDCKFTIQRKMERDEASGI